MEFYDLYVPAKDPEEVLESVEDMEFDGVALSHRYENKGLLNDYLEKVDELSRDTSLKLIRCCTLDAETPEELKKRLGKVRQKVDVVAVEGGDFDVNNAAVRDRRVDLLLHPEHKRKDPGMDHKTVKMATENEVAMGFVLHDLHQTYGKIRSHVIGHIKKTVELCQKYDANFVVTSGARDLYELRGPRELASLLKVLGVEPSEAMDSVSSVPRRIVEENRKKLGGKIKKDGVEEI